MYKHTLGGVYALVKTLHLVFGIGVIITLAGGCATEPQASKPVLPSAEASAGSADVHSFRDQTPWGVLGKRLGTPVVIDGEYDDEAKLPNVLRVQRIDSIQRGAVLPLQILRTFQLRKGVHYVLEGYELGEFVSEPGWLLSSDKPSIKYRSLFAVTSVVEPADQPVVLRRVGGDNILDLLDVPAKQQSQRARELAEKLASSQVPTRAQAESAALDAFHQIGLDMRELWDVTGLFALGRDEPDFGSAGDLVWEVRINRMSTYPTGVSGVVWVSAKTKKAKVLFP
jgi:hypothetical protein